MGDGALGDGALPLQDSSRRRPPDTTKPPGPRAGRGASRKRRARSRDAYGTSQVSNATLSRTGSAVVPSSFV